MLTITKIRKEANLPTPVALATHVTRIQTLQTVHNVLLYFAIAGVPATSAEIGAQVGTIRIKLDGETIVELTAARLLALYKYYRDQMTAWTVAGVLPIPFTRFDLPTWADNRTFALGMLGEDGKSYRTMTVEVVYLGAVTIDSAQVYYEHDLLAPEITGLHVRRLTYTRTFAGTGDQEITDLPKDKVGAGILAYHFDVSTGTIATITVKANGSDIWESLPIDVLHLMLHKSGRVAQTDFAHLDFAACNDAGGFVPMGSPNLVDWLIRPDWSVSPAGSFAIIAEEIHTGI